MFYSTRGWFRDLTYFSVFVLFSSALVDSAYGQQRSSVPAEGIARGSGQTTSSATPYTNRTSATRLTGPPPNAGSSFRSSQPFSSTPVSAWQPNAALTSELQQSIRQAGSPLATAHSNA